MTDLDNAPAEQGEGHTPWIVETGATNLWIGKPKAIGTKVDQVVVSLDYGPGYTREFYVRQERNARLIAAAPDLLAAAQHARMCVPFPSDAHTKLVAAIARAQGSSK